MPSLIILEGLSRSELDTTERTAIDIALDLHDPLDKLGVGETHTHTPTWHVVGFRHRVELDTAVLRTRYLKDTQMLLTQDEAVGIIVDYHDAMRLGKLHQTLIGLTTGTTSCRHVGIVGPHELHLREIHLLQFVEVGLPTVVLTQIIVHDLRA